MLDYAASMDSVRGEEAPLQPGAPAASAPPEEDASAGAPPALEPQDCEPAPWDLEAAPRELDADELSESSLSVSEPGAAKKHKGTCPPQPEPPATALLHAAFRAGFLVCFLSWPSRPQPLPSTPQRTCAQGLSPVGKGAFGVLPSVSAGVTSAFGVHASSVRAKPGGGRVPPCWDIGASAHCASDSPSG